VLAFRDEYTLLDEETGEVFELLQTERVKPIIKLLPTEDVIVSGQSMLSSNPPSRLVRADRLISFLLF
jgi:hypothetical protein